MIKELEEFSSSEVVGGADLEIFMREFCHLLFSFWKQFLVNTFVTFIGNKDNLTGALRLYLFRKV